MQKTSSSHWSGWLRANGFYAAFLIFLIAFPFILGALTESSPYGVARGDRMIMRGESVRWQAVLIEVYILSILAMSYNLLFGFTGVISFGHALFFGLSAYVLGLIFLDHPDWDSTISLIVGCVAAIGICGILGLLMGLVTLRLKGVYFAIFTLAVAEMAFIFLGRWERTHAEDGFALNNLPLWIDPTQNRLTFYYIALALFAFTFMFIRRLMASPTGAVFEAIRENEDRAQSIGYDTLRYKIFSIVVSSMLAGMAGLLHVMLNKKVGPELLAVSHTVDPLLMTLIGGSGTLLGPIIGASGLHLLDVFLSDTTFTIGSTVIQVANVWQFLLGAIFIAAVLVFPYGVIGTWRRWRTQSKQR